MFLGRPADVARKVTLVVINAFDRVFGGWAPTNIGQEGCVALDPLIADCYTSAAVILVTLGVRVQAPKFDTDPGSILRSALAFGVTVSGHAA